MLSTTKLEQELAKFGDSYLRYLHVLLHQNFYLKRLQLLPIYFNCPFLKNMQNKILLKTILKCNNGYILESDKFNNTEFNIINWKSKNRYLISNINKLVIITFNRILYTVIWQILNFLNIMTLKINNKKYRTKNGCSQSTVDISFISIHIWFDSIFSIKLN